MGRTYLRSELDHDPRVLQLCALTGLDVFAVIGRLWKLWSYFDQHSRDGTVPGLTRDMLERLVGDGPQMSRGTVDDRPGFVPGLCHDTVRWCVIHADGVTLPDYQRHNGQSHKERMEHDRLRKQMQRAKRRGRRAFPSVPSLSPGTEQTCPTPVPPVSPVTSRNESVLSAYPITSSLALQRKKKPPSGGKKKADHKVPIDWQPNREDTARVATECQLDDPRVCRELAVFRDYEFKSARTDWDAAWRNWLRRAGAENGKVRMRSSSQANQEAIQRFVETTRLEEANEQPVGGK